MSDKYPIDVLTLVRGQHYNMRAIGLMQSDPGSSKTSLELLRLKTDIEKEIARVGRRMSIRIEGEDTIYVMTDYEAAEYHDRQCHKAIRSMRSHIDKAQTNVDPSMLTVDERARHERQIALRAAQYFALSNVGRKRIEG